MPSQEEYRRQHNIHLITQLLGSPHNVSPFNLILDSLEQSARPLVNEYIRRANQKDKVVYVSFEEFKKPAGVDVFIEGWKQTPTALNKSILTQTLTPSNTKTLLFIDALNPLASSTELASFLSSFITPQICLLAVWHLDVPILARPSSYTPSPLTLIKFLATTVFQVHSFSHVLEEKAARDKSLANPVFGLAEEVEGVITGLRSASAGSISGVVVEMEHRRKSGRAVKEVYFIPTSTKTIQVIAGKVQPKETAILLEDHPLYRRPTDEDVRNEDMETTFNLNLTEKQRRDREGIVLPYHDAQKGEGGEGGRILYEMGVEDDFDEEEDEI